MLFDNLSPKTDFSSKIQLDLKILNGNILYLTHEIDKIRKTLTDLRLGQQTLDYFDKDSKHIPEVEPDEHE